MNVPAAALVVSLSLAVCACDRPPSAPATALEPPDRIVLIVVDTLRADYVGAYGGEVATSNMDRLAAEGQVFERAVASFHQTSMAMGAMFAGVAPSIESGTRARALPWTSRTFCGMVRFSTAADPACVPASIETLAEALGAEGFETIGITANPLLFRPYGYDQGFDVWHEVGPLPEDPLRRRGTREHAEQRTGRAVNAAVFEALVARQSDRFFLYVHYLDVHDWLLRGHGYKKGVRALDAHLGDLLEGLTERGLMEGTSLVLTADHGEALREEHPIPALAMHFGNPSYEPVLRVPLIVSPPAFPDTDAWVRGQDIRSLVLALARAEPLELAGSGEQLITEHRYQTYRRGRFKSVWPRDGDPPLLFDVVADPGETRSIAGAHRDVLAEHRGRIDVLADNLGWSAQTAPDLTRQDRERLRALGYLD